jgi:hypothetical protein
MILISAKMSRIWNTASKCVYHTIDSGSELSSSLSEGSGAVDQLSFCFLRATAAFWGLPFLLGGAFLGPGRRRPAVSPEDSLKGTRGHEIEFKIFDKMDSSRQCCETWSESISQRYGSGSGSFYNQAKIVRKTLIPTVLWLLYYFLSLTNYLL